MGSTLCAECSTPVPGQIPKLCLWLSGDISLSRLGCIISGAFRSGNADGLAPVMCGPLWAKNTLPIHTGLASA